MARLNPEPPAVDGDTAPCRPLAVVLTPAARARLDGRSDMLFVEMELFFSCLVRKRLRLDSEPLAGAAVWRGVGHERLTAWFHPVMAQHCALQDDSRLEDLPLADFPLARRGAFQPRWLRLDLRDGRFVGDFGWQQGGPPDRA